MTALFLAACAILFAVPLYFVVNQVYQDGVIGRGSLLAISFSAAGFLLEATFGVPVYVHPLFVVMTLAFAVFMSWHIFKFHARMLKKEGQWKPQSQSLRT